MAVVLSDDGERLILRAEIASVETQRLYSLQRLRQDATFASLDPAHRTTASTPISQETFEWTLEEPRDGIYQIFTNPTVAFYRVWTLHPWWQAPLGIPK